MGRLVTHVERDTRWGVGTDVNDDHPQPNPFQPHIRLHQRLVDGSRQSLRHQAGITPQSHLGPGGNNLTPHASGVGASCRPRRQDRLATARRTDEPLISSESDIALVARH